MERTPAACPHRDAMPSPSARAAAQCRLVEQLVGELDETCAVARDVCEQCCRWETPAEDRLNPAVASLLYSAAARIAKRGGAAGFGAAKAIALGDRALRRVETIAAQPRHEERPTRVWEVPAPSQRIDPKITVSSLTAHLERGEPFTCVRYGDGEWLSMLGACGKNGDGHDFLPETMGCELRESLEYAAKVSPREQWYVGLSETWYHPSVHVYLAVRPWLDAIHWIGANLFVEGFRDFSTRRFLETIRDYPGRKYLVAKESLALVAGGLGCTHVIIPPVNCYLGIGRAQRAGAFRGPGIVVCCAGMASEVLLRRLHGRNPAGTYIDFGHAFDAMVGMLTRQYAQRNEGGIVDFLLEHYTPMFVRNV